jgi:hypothetical protein
MLEAAGDMIKNEFTDIGFEIWMRLLKTEGQSYDSQSENIERQHPSENQVS